MPRLCEQAIFTSQRSPTGEGYRIVAASPGVRAADKAIITRRAPSHGALHGEGGHALGLLAFPLEGDRYCVGISRFAGREYSGRGGERVWTRFALLDDDTFAAFGRNAIRVHAALADRDEIPAAQKLSPAIPQLTLPAWSYAAESFKPGQNDPFRRFVQTVLDGGCWIVQGWGADWPLIEWALDVAPAALRRQLGLSCGVSYSRDRQVQLAVFDVPQDSLARSVQGHDIRWCNLVAEEPLKASAYDAWLGFAQVRATQGRLPCVARLADRVTSDYSAASLARLADLSLDADIAARAVKDELAALRQKYADFSAASPLESELLNEVQALLTAAAEAEALEEDEVLPAADTL